MTREEYKQIIGCNFIKIIDNKKKTQYVCFPIGIYSICKHFQHQAALR